MQSSKFARDMMAQKLMSENKDNPFNSRFFQPSDALSPPRYTGLLLPIERDMFGEKGNFEFATPRFVTDAISGINKFGQAMRGQLSPEEIQKLAFDTSLNVTGGTLLGSKLIKGAVPRDALAMGLSGGGSKGADKSNRFLHGTLTDNISDIKKLGLIPGVGKNTKEAYGEYSDLLEDALYVSRPEDAERALSAIRNQVGIKLKKQASEVTDQDIVDNGALVVTRSKKDTSIYEAGEGGETFSISGEKSFFETNVSDEPGDIVSKDILPATGILKGKALKKFFEKQGLLSSGSRATKTVDDVKTLDDIKNKYPNVDLSVFSKPEGITLSKIVVPEGARSEGIGSNVMKDLIKYADENNLPIALTPDSTFGGSKTRLKSFYRKFGFKDNKGRNKDFSFRESMIRQPKSK